ncbi:MULTISPECIES: serine/threonine-protein kinase [unclassified Agrococcus]|uniref:serine/threonine-protein kinase n=1 Tax=unclassified Agrococcus TaxID=2615065 RepID=UPI00360A3ED0
MDGDSQHDAFAPGALLAGRYRIGERIARGGSGAVHRATDEVLGRDVAVKAVASTATDAATAERERLEIDLLATLSHRSLVTIFDAVPTRIDGVEGIALVMELVDGPTLGARRAEGPIVASELRRMAQDVAEALAVVHAAGVVHRDVKPSNILLAPSPLPEHEFDARLADFGIAAVEGAEPMTATGTVLGTAAYLSPEQATGGRVGPAADVYALGLVLLEAITGDREFPGPAIEALTARMLRDPVIPPTVDARWTTLLRSMTMREPDARPTIDEVRESLARLDGVPITVGDAGDDADAATTTLPLAAVAGAAGAGAAVAGAAGAADAGAAAASDPTAATAAVPAAAAASTATTVMPAVQADRGALGDTRARRRRLGVIAAIAAGVLVLGGIGALALQAIQRGDDPAPSSPAEVADPSPEPSQTPTPEPTPTEETEAPATSTPPSAPPSEPAPSEPAPAPSEPAPTTSQPAPPPAPEPVPTPVPSAPVPSEPAPTETTPVDPVPTSTP